MRSDHEEEQGREHRSARDARQVRALRRPLAISARLPARLRGPGRAARAALRATHYTQFPSLPFFLSRPRPHMTASLRRVARFCATPRVAVSNMLLGVYEGDNGLERGCSKTCSVLPKAFRRPLPLPTLESPPAGWASLSVRECAFALHLNPSTCVYPSDSVLLSQAQASVCGAPIGRHNVRRENGPG